jgi:MFS family permease
VTASLRTVFAGRRGRLLAGLLLAEFAGALQSVAYSAVLPLASRELGGSALYGATLAAGSLTTILVLSAGSWLLTRLTARSTLFIATALYLAGVVVAATAPTMVLVLVGSILRGLAGGLLAGFVLTVIGSLFDDVLRPRVLGLYALMWVLPSLVGASLNGVIAVTFGWRWAMAWPAAIVLVARIMIGRDVGIVPWRGADRRSDVRNGALVLCGLVIASLASAEHQLWAIGVFVAGLALAAWASMRTVRTMLNRDTPRARHAAAFLALCLAYFGGAGLVSLGVVEGLHRGAVAGSIAVGTGLLAWSLTGARPPRSDLRMLGLALLIVALATESVAQMVPRAAAMVIAVAAWAIGGLGMGLCYPRFCSAPLDDLAPEQVAPVATAVEFAELAGTALGALVGGGVYSLADGLGVTAPTAIATGFGLLAGLAVLAVALARRARSPLSSVVPAAP